MFKRLLGLFKPKQEEKVSPPETTNNLKGVSKELLDESFRKSLEGYSEKERAKIVAEIKKANIPGLADLLAEYSAENIEETVEDQRFIKIRSSFNDYCADEYDESIKMVKRPQLGHVYNIETWGSWSGRYVINQDEKGSVYLDFYANHRTTNSRHSRIFQDGRMESLESYWEFGAPIYSDDLERTQKEAQGIRDQNERVSQLLKAKGLIDQEC